MEEEIKEDNFYEDDIENLTKPTQFFTQIQFNQEKLKNSEIINTKLDDKENPPSLEDILLLEGIVDEIHNKNKKLINFFTKEKIKQSLLLSLKLQ